MEWLVMGSLPESQRPPAEFTAARAGWQAIWLGARILGGIVLVPVVEELAFRGYVLRRLQSADVDQVPLNRWTPWAIAGSSLLFGILHGERWLAGTMAGAIYAWSMTRRGSIADAICAHGITNALIAASVLIFGTWSLW
jgi:CAAX prenyl protease-like protein